MKNKIYFNHNKKNFLSIVLGTLTLFVVSVANATDNRKIELKTLKIQGNKELPKMLFIVPWKNSDDSKFKKAPQQLVLHSLYGDLFDPVTPGAHKASTADLISITSGVE